MVINLRFTVKEENNNKEIGKYNIAKKSNRLIMSNENFMLTCRTERNWLI